MRVATDFGTRDVAIIIGTIALLDGAEQDVEHALGVGLDVAGVTGEQSVHDLAGLLGRELEEHVIRVGDLDEEVGGPTRLALLVFARYGLHADTGGVGRNAVCGSEGLLAHRLDDRRAGRAAHLLEPAAHRAAIDRHAETCEAIFLAMQRQAIAELVARDVREERRRRLRALDEPRRHWRCYDHGASRAWI